MREQFPYPKSVENKQIRSLREDGPQFSEELPRGSRFNGKARPFVGRIAPPWTGQTIWYIWGDERRAVRRFINKYTDQVREHIEKENNSKLASQMDSSMWRLVCEEWMWEGHISDEMMTKLRSEYRDTGSAGDAEDDE